MNHTNPPNTWVTVHTRHINPQGHVLDVACGPGRHSRYLLSAGYRVTAVDINVSGIEDLAADPRCKIVQADLETSPTRWPFEVNMDGSGFDGILVSNYLHRPLFPYLVDSLAPGGVLIYQTFMLGNEKYGKPGNPDFLLCENELMEVFGTSLEVMEFHQGYVDDPRPAMMQGICCRSSV
ncbi:MAG TPA: class I SAM-dependent methyltransferase [Gammaproteobacteria bacterium]|nr:class I SAM-dependent methyltransferase [Gammaproteobacteria bacterium]HIL95122.1 class I SAM-dependent methyltransferase [Pseudomonadales bacterium]